MASPDASTTNGFVGVFRTPDEGGSIRVRLKGALESKTLPTMTCTEEVIEGGTAPVAIAALAISAISIQEGTVVGVMIHRSLNNSDWIPVPTFVIETPLTGNDATVTVRVANIPWSKRGVTNYFKAFLLNADGEVAWAHSGAGAGAAPSITADASFNGTTDVAEYPEVTGLLVANVGTTDGNAYETPTPLPTNGVARLQWDDMRLGHSSGTQNLYVPNYTTGARTSTAISNAKIQQLEGYVIFMFICLTAAPTLFCPNNSATDTTKGTWYKLAECTTNYYDVSVPRNKTVAFWVGCKMKTTTNKLGDGTVTTVQD